MNNRVKQQLEALLERICELTAELDNLHGWEIRRKLGNPATSEEIAIIQRTAGFPLPPDYRAFLELHNGWVGFNGENDILSAEQMGRGEMARSIAETKALQQELNDPAAQGFVINASISGSDTAYIDQATQRPDGTADVVRWDPRAREYARYPSFIAYLDGFAQSLQRRIAKQRERLR